MKSTEEFKASVYEKRDARLATAKKFRRRALFCLPVAAVLVAAGIFAGPKLSLHKPETDSGNSLYTLRAQPEKLLDLSPRAAYEQFYGKMDQAMRKESVSDDELEEFEREEKKLKSQVDALRNELEKSGIDPAFSQSVNDFARDSTLALAQTDFKENACYSPLSLYYALAMLGDGARGETRQEFLDVLHLSDMDWAAEQCKRFYRQHYHDSSLSQFRLANSLWLDDRCDFEQDFLGNAADNFYASLLNTDFTDPTTGEAISGWISDNTEGLLEPQLEFDQSTLLAVVNTIYLSEQWTDEFYQDMNTTGDFTKSDGSKVTAEYMHKTDTYSAVFLGEKYTRASLELKESGEMIFILPDEGVTVEELLSDPETFEEMFYPRSYSEAEGCQLTWSVPKFSFDSDYNLIDTLRALGLETALDPYNADFSGVGHTNEGNQNLYFSQAKQGVHIGVDEDGVEAAAYTMLALAAGAATPPDKKVEMTLDRPFLFAILSNDRLEDSSNSETPSGTLMFVGVCGEPTIK